jgi:hypothetical protein
VGHRVQGIVIRSHVDPATLGEIERSYGYRLYGVVPGGLWLLDLGVPAPVAPDPTLVKTARHLAPAYVDAVRLLAPDEIPPEQLAWLIATAAVGDSVGQRVLGFLSDDLGTDFAAIAAPEGVSVVDDHVPPYLLRWEGGSLTVEPYLAPGPGAQPPNPPEELGLIPAASLLPAELLEGGYPLHGNVMAELSEFAPAAAGAALGLLSPEGPQAGSLRLLEAHGLSHSIWDQAAGAGLPGTG